MAYASLYVCVYVCARVIAPRWATRYEKCLPHQTKIILAGLVRLYIFVAATISCRNWDRAQTSKLLRPNAACTGAGNVEPHTGPRTRRTCQPCHATRVSNTVHTHSDTAIHLTRNPSHVNKASPAHEHMPRRTNTLFDECLDKASDPIFVKVGHVPVYHTHTPLPCLSVRPSFCLSICPSICQSVCLCVSLCL
jgi:hypothetical protein